MSLLAVITALLLEQIRPFSSRTTLYGGLAAYAGFFERQFNAGELRHGRIAWLLAVVPLLVCVALMFWLFWQIHPVVAWLFNIVVLYLTMGFRQFSHYFTRIHQALLEDRLDDARGLLSQWRGIPSHELNREEVSRLAIEEALLASHHHVFGVIVWFVATSLLGLGPVGAVLYRLARFLESSWAPENIAEPGRFGEFARQAITLLEWLPVRITALTFAIVGNFEDTVYCWRTQSARWPDKDAGILLASGAGAMGVRLGMPIPEGGMPLDRPEIGIGDDADPDFMQSAIGLVWRAIALWLLLLLLMTLANLVG